MQLCGGCTWAQPALHRVAEGRDSPSHTISVTITNGVLDVIDIIPGGPDAICNSKAACSFTFAGGQSYAGVQLINGAPFTYDCGDGVLREAGNGSNGACGFTGEGWEPLTLDHTVTVTLN